MFISIERGQRVLLLLWVDFASSNTIPKRAGERG